MISSTIGLIIFVRFIAPLISETDQCTGITPLALPACAGTKGTNAGGSKYALTGNQNISGISKISTRLFPPEKLPRLNLAFTKTTENDRTNPAAPGRVPAPGVRVPDTGRRYVRPGGAGTG